MQLAPGGQTACCFLSCIWWTFQNCDQWWIQLTKVFAFYKCTWNHTVERCLASIECFIQSSVKSSGWRVHLFLESWSCVFSMNSERLRIWTIFLPHCLIMVNYTKPDCETQSYFNFHHNIKIKVKLWHDLVWLWNHKGCIKICAACFREKHGTAFCYT